MHGLRETYEAWLADDETVDAAEVRRTDLLREVAASSIRSKPTRRSSLARRAMTGRRCGTSSSG